jgi:hypothetical protein
MGRRSQSSATKRPRIDVSGESQNVSEQVDPRLRSFIVAMADAIFEDIKREREKK